MIILVKGFGGASSVVRPPGDPPMGGDNFDDFITGYNAPGWFDSADMTHKVLDARGYGVDAIANALNEIQTSGAWVEGDTAFIALPAGRINGCNIGGGQNGAASDQPAAGTYTKNIPFHLCGPTKLKSEDKATIIGPVDHEPGNGQGWYAQGAGDLLSIHGPRLSEYGSSTNWDGICYFWYCEMKPKGRSLLHTNGQLGIYATADPRMQSMRFKFCDFFDLDSLPAGTSDNSYYKWGFQIYDSHITVHDCRWKMLFAQEHNIYQHTPLGLTYGPGGGYGDNIIQDTDFDGSGGQVWQVTNRNRSAAEGGLTNGGPVSFNYEGPDRGGLGGFIMRGCTATRYGGWSGKGAYPLTFYGKGNIVIEDSMFWNTDQTYRINTGPTNTNSGFMVIRHGTEIPSGTTYNTVESVPREYFGRYHHGSIVLSNVMYWDNSPSSSTREIIKVDGVQNRFRMDDCCILSNRNKPWSISSDEDGYYYAPGGVPRANTGVNGVIFNNVNTGAMKMAMEAAIPDYTVGDEWGGAGSSSPGATPPIIRQAAVPRNDPSHAFVQAGAGNTVETPSNGDYPLDL